MRSGKVAGAALSFALALGLASGTASAQRGGGGGTVVGPSAQAPGTKYRIQPLNLHREALGTDAFAAAGRARMRNGDCKGALDDFDLALRSTLDPTIYRDRGLCHERLGDPYPAIDDFRVYVTASPDAADADGIRQRLARLEMDVYHHSSASSDSDEGGVPGISGSASTTKAASVTVAVGAEPKRDAMEEVEHDHDEIQSSLRAGKGFGLAPFFSEQKWNTPGSSFGDSTTWSESVGLQLRYAVSSGSAFYLEGGWELFNSTDVATISGLSSQLGYEVRVPLDAPYNNQFLVGLGLGFEYLILTPKDVSQSGSNAAVFVPRIRAGWRHMLTTSVGLDLTLGVGITGKALATNNFLESTTPGASSPPVEIIAANLGVVWGM
ncbi:MAG TPA: tetratricopeptide repeat protein [Polyangiaceae bacterium]|jgi:hypothetical protein|nr:tetratricopeptide repeat protein [Polyangiaceae bacterium]